MGWRVSPCERIAVVSKSPCWVRVGRPVDVAYAVWFLASRYADYITGEILHVDAGYHVVGMKNPAAPDISVV